MCPSPCEEHAFHNGRSTDTTSDGIPTRISAIRGTAALKLLHDLNRDHHTTHRISASYGWLLASR
jgi:hypothetical protein